jgi:hypothetical protein
MMSTAALLMVALLGCAAAAYASASGETAYAEYNETHPEAFPSAPVKKT